VNNGLSVSNVVNVDVFISPLAAGYRNFGTLLVITPEDVIDVGERVRYYSNIDEVIEEFGGTGPAYEAGLLYFSQLPRPNALYVGRWAQANTSAVLHGGILAVADLDMATWAAITTGSLILNIGGTDQPLSGLNFASTTNMNQVAAVIQAAGTGYTVTWDAAYERFDIKTTAKGPTAVIGYGKPITPASGVDISSKAKLRQGEANAPIIGVLAETPLAAVQACADRSAEWYAVAMAHDPKQVLVDPTDNELVDISAYIEGSERNRLHIITAQKSAVLDPLNATDICSRLKALRYMRSFTQYSSTNPNAAVSAFGRAATVDFEANNTTMTLKFKQEPGVGVEVLTETQNKILRSKNGNVFVLYDNDTAILQEGVMANGFFFDEVHNSDWYANALQYDVWNLLYQSQTKIPQTDEGINQIVATCERTSERAVNNGFLAPGLWTGGPIGLLRPFMQLSRGYYVYAPPVATQPPAEREARKAPTLQIAAKAAGAVHFVNVIVSLNRALIFFAASGTIMATMFGGLGGA
jgi:hypothetical protein